MTTRVTMATRGGDLRSGCYKGYYDYKVNYKNYYKNDYKGYYGYKRG